MSNDNKAQKIIVIILVAIIVVGIGYILVSDSEEINKEETYTDLKKEYDKSDYDKEEYETKEDYYKDNPDAYRK